MLLLPLGMLASRIIGLTPCKPCRSIQKVGQRKQLRRPLPLLLILWTLQQMLPPMGRKIAFIWESSKWNTISGHSRQKAPEACTAPLARIFVVTQYTGTPNSMDRICPVIAKFNAFNPYARFAWRTTNRSSCPRQAQTVNWVEQRLHHRQWAAVRSCLFSLANYQQLFEDT